MKIYILTIVDLDSVGFETKDVELYTNKADAIESMRKQYLEKCEKWEIDTPYAENDYMHAFDENYAYIFGEHYWDIFEKELEI